MKITTLTINFLQCSILLSLIAVLLALFEAPDSIIFLLCGGSIGCSILVIMSGMRNWKQY
jgi:hypothetical protein